VYLTACSAPLRPQAAAPIAAADAEIDRRLALYAPVRLSVDASVLSQQEKQLAQKLATAAALIERAYWEQVHPGGWELRRRLARSPSPTAAKLLRLLIANAGPFDLRSDAAPLVGTSPRPPGGGLYPPDLDREELEAYFAAHPGEREALAAPRTAVRRRGGRLVAVPYHEEYAAWIRPAAAHLEDAAVLAGDTEFARFLGAVAEILRTDRAVPLDWAWLFDPAQRVTVALGPPAWQEGDALLGVKTAYSLSVGVKNPQQEARSRLLLESAADAQRALQLDPGPRAERVATDLALAVADDLARGGLIAHGQQQSAPLLAGSGGPGAGGHLLWSNVFAARFQHLFLPKARSFLAAASYDRLTFQGYFDTVLAHYLGHALGPDRTRREAAAASLGREADQALEEAKAEALALFALRRLRERGRLPAGLAAAHETAHLAHMFLILHDHSRAGRAPNHWVRAALLTIAWHAERGGLAFETGSGRWSIHPGRVDPAAEALAREILAIQVTADGTRAERLLARGASLPAKVERAVAVIDAVRPVQVAPEFTIRRCAKLRPQMR
jgi:hypothetical protein